MVLPTRGNGPVYRRMKSMELSPKEYATKLKNQNNDLKALVLVITALVVVALMMMIFVGREKINDMHRKAEKINESTVRTIPAFNEGATKAVNQYRTSKQLSHLKDLASDIQDPQDYLLVAAWQGCAHNHYFDKSWAKQDCSKLGNMSPGFRTTVEVFPMEGKGSEAPSTDDLVDMLDRKYVDSTDKGKKVALPSILKKNVNQSMFYLVGDGGEKKWKLYIFTAEKKTP